MPRSLSGALAIFMPSRVRARMRSDCGEGPMTACGSCRTGLRGCVTEFPVIGDWRDVDDVEEPGR